MLLEIDIRRIGNRSLKSGIKSLLINLGSKLQLQKVVEILADIVISIILESVLLRAPIFNGENYEFWSIRMKTIFKSHGLWEFVEKGVECSDSKGADESAEKENEKEESRDAAFLLEKFMKDAKALGLIQGAVFDEIFPQISHQETFKGAWDILMQEFHGDKQVRSYKVYKVWVENLNILE